MSEYKEGRMKGNSLLEFPKDYTVIDLETTGYDPHWDDIIEIGMIKYREGKEVDRLSSLVRPEDDLYIPEFIEELTGITSDMLKDAPTFESIKESVWAFLKDEVIVGHNVNFDINFLYDIFAEDGLILGNDFADTMRISRRVLPELDHHRLVDLYQFYSNEDRNYHRAVDDCETTAFVLAELEKTAAERNTDFKPNKNKKWNGRHSIDLRTLIGNPEAVDEESPLFGKRCVFTGKLEKLTRAEAGQLVVDIGGICENNVTKKTNFLIFGNLDYASNVKDGKSNKLKKAESLISSGQDLTILSESAFYDMVLDE